MRCYALKHTAIVVSALRAHGPDELKQTMNRARLSASSASQLRAAIGATRQLLTELPADTCDVADVEELLAWAERELAKPLPNAATLAVPLNSVARSLASEPEGRKATLTLDAAMREAGIVTSWEH